MIAGAIACWSLATSGPASADADVVLFLGPGQAIEVVEAARRAREREERAVAPRPLDASPVVPARSMHDIVPSRFHIPDGYEIDLEREVPRFAMPVDRDNMVSFELLDRGVGVFLDYDEEAYPMGDGGDVLMLQLERRF